MDQYNNSFYPVNKIIVHAGNFHADDVFCVAAMRLINPNVLVERLFQAVTDVTDLEQGIIMADIGGGAFDHHQPDAPLRDDGIRHCAVSRLWLAFGLQVVSTITGEPDFSKCEEILGSVYRELIRTIAIVDNGLDSGGSGQYTIAEIIDRYIPAWNSSETIDEAFFKAVAVAEQVLTKEIYYHYSIVQGKEKIKKAIEHMKNGIIVLNEYVPWEKEAVASTEALAVIFPSNRGGYNMQLVPVDVGSFETRASVPEEWKGKRDEQADAVLKGMTFCHVNGFLSAFKDLNDALIASGYIYKKN